MKFYVRLYETRKLAQTGCYEQSDLLSILDIEALLIVRHSPEVQIILPHSITRKARGPKLRSRTQTKRRKIAHQGRETGPKSESKKGYGYIDSEWGRPLRSTPLQRPGSLSRSSWRAAICTRPISLADLRAATRGRASGNQESSNVQRGDHVAPCPLAARYVKRLTCIDMLAGYVDGGQWWCESSSAVAGVGDPWSSTP